MPADVKDDLSKAGINAEPFGVEVLSEAFVICAALRGQGQSDT